MNSIEKLVAKLCPDGVEFRALGEVLQSTSNIRWNDSLENEFRYIDLSSVDRITHSISGTKTINAKTAPSRAQKIIMKNDVLFGTTRPMLKRYCLISDEFSEQICSTGFCVLRADSLFLIPKFLFHIFGTQDFYDYIELHQQGANYPAISDKAVKSYRIPVPPLEIQQEIVNILDTYSELVAELVVELEAELESRRLQYQYYRDELLNFSGAPSAIHRSLGLHTTDKVEFKALKDLGSTYGGLTGKNKSDFTDGNARYITYRNIANNISVNTTENEFVKVTEKEKQNRIEFGDVLFTASSETPNEVGMSSEVCSHSADPIFLNSFCFGFRFDDKDLFESGFLKYLFRSNHIRKQIIKCANGVTRFNISKNRFMKIFIPIPPLAIQREIVSILDKFEALINDLSVGLPAEIDARRQQYEYYRDKLLTFKEKV